jgi:hypothetical protein
MGESHLNLPRGSLVQPCSQLEISAVMTNRKIEAQGAREEKHRAWSMEHGAWRKTADR